MTHLQSEVCTEKKGGLRQFVFTVQADVEIFGFCKRVCMDFSISTPLLVGVDRAFMHHPGLEKDCASFGALRFGQRRLNIFDLFHLFTKVTHCSGDAVFPLKISFCGLPPPRCRGDRPGCGGLARSSHAPAAGPSPGACAACFAGPRKCRLLRGNFRKNSQILAKF